MSLNEASSFFSSWAVPGFGTAAKMQRKKGRYARRSSRLGRFAEARYIGAHANGAVAWEATRNLSVEAYHLHFFPGGFLKEVGLGRTVDFAGVWATFKL